MERHRRVYDNWARLVESTLNRDYLRQIALCPSISSDTSLASSFSPDFTTSASSRFSFRVNSIYPHQPVYLKHQSMAKPILLASHLIRAAQSGSSYSEAYLDLHSRAQKLTDLVGKAELAAHELYDRPTRRVIHDTCHSLYKALSVVLKCRRGVPANVAAAAAFSNASAQLDSSIRNLCWLLRVEEDLQGMPPPISMDEPALCEVWVLIATLCTGSIEDQCNAAASLLSLANEDDVYRKLIIQEGGVRPLLRFVRDLQSLQDINAPKNHLFMTLLRVESGIRSLFEIILKECPMKDLAVAVPLLAELTAHFSLSSDNSEPQDSFMLLVDHLEFAPSNNFRNINLDDLTKEMSGRALWSLTRGNSELRRSVEKSGTLLGFAVLLEEGSKLVQYYSAMALLKVTTAAEGDHDFRISVFKPNSPARRAVVEQLYRIVHEAIVDSKLLIPCVGSIGNLARIFGAREARKIINPLVNLLDEQDADIAGEACGALTKLALIDNFACPHRSKAIVRAGGVKRLVGLLYFGGQMLQRCALVLLCHIALRVPQCLELMEAEVVPALAWASEKCLLEADEDGKKLLPKTRYSLEWYRSRGWKGD